MTIHPSCELPDPQAFGLVTYSAPAWAFEDRTGHIHDMAVVSWPGRLALRAATRSPARPHGACSTRVESYQQQMLAGRTVCQPDDHFCDLTVAADSVDEQTFAISVSTFGRVARYLQRDGQHVHPGEPLFEFDARPPTTAEWLGQHAEAHKQRRLKLDLWFVLMGSPLKLARWRWKHRHGVPADLD